MSVIGYSFFKGAKNDCDKGLIFMIGMKNLHLGCKIWMTIYPHLGSKSKPHVRS